MVSFMLSKIDKLRPLKVLADVLSVNKAGCLNSGLLAVNFPPFEMRTFLYPLLTDKSEAFDVRADAADLPQTLTHLPPQFD